MLVAMRNGIVNGTGFLKGKTERLEKELSNEMCWELSDQSIMWPPQEGFIFSTEVNNESHGLTRLTFFSRA